MTIEEKISFLNQVKIILLDNNSWLDGTKEPIEESFDAAIKSLEWQEEFMNKVYEQNQEAEFYINGRRFRVREVPQ